ncbi:MAG: hypothetical protein AMJ90_09650 [candidate division Zixibacteria bacterium SM23_73_2]|nr:MAG: hypothetical protein AMJ90_09650 [candidate division Zixibacteria bacterium SM23_73_2]
MIKKILTDKYTVLLFRIILGATFIYASLDKIAHPAQFAQIVHNYKILPSFLINLFAISLPWIELFCGIFLIVGIWVESSSLVLSFLLFLFAVAISYNVFIRGLDINCGCFTTSLTAKKQGAELLIRDFILLGMGLQVIFFNRDRFTLSGLFSQVSKKD